MERLRRLIPLILKTAAGIVVLGIVITITNAMFDGWWEKLFLNFRGGTDNSAITVAHESADYFRKYGEKIDFLFEDIDAVQVKARTLDVYRIEIEEQIHGEYISQTLRRSIVFEQNKNVVKVEVDAYEVPRNPTTESELLPSGTYYIITEDGETYILMERDGKKSNVRSVDNPALYDKLLSYGIERIIDYDAFKQDGISCYEAAKVREYSTLNTSVLEHWPGIYLREYQSMPGGYYMEYGSHRSEYWHIIEANFHYSRVNGNVPKLGDYQ